MGRTWRRFAFFVPWLWLLGIIPAVAASPTPVSDDAASCHEDVQPYEDVTCTVLYAHIFGLMEAGRLNTQPPICDDVARGMTTFPTVEPVYDFNQMRFFFSPGLIDPDECEGTHSQLGLAGDAQVGDLGLPWHAFFYLSADVDEFSMAGLDPSADTGLMPCVTLRIGVYEGSRAQPAWLVTEGYATQTLLNSPHDLPDPPLRDPCPDSQGRMVSTRVTEFAIDLPPPVRHISQARGLSVHAEWWQHDASGHHVAQREWNVHSGPEHRPRLVLPIVEPIRIETLAVDRAEGKAWIEAGISSVWGAYDVDVDSVRLEAFTPVGDAVPLRFLGQPKVTYTLQHDGSFRPVNVTYAWQWQKEDLPPGVYTLRVSVHNLQHTALAHQAIQFTVPSVIGQTPGPGPGLVLLALVVLVGLRGRSQC